MSVMRLPDPPPAGVFRVSAEAAESLHRQFADWPTADLSAASSLAPALQQLGRDFAFPDWYGANLDALHDCLTEPDWPDQAKGVLVRGLDVLLQRDAGAGAALAEVFLSAAEIRRDSGCPLCFALETAALDLPALPSA